LYFLENITVSSESYSSTVNPTTNETISVYAKATALGKEPSVMTNVTTNDDGTYTVIA
jgi:hypothetical protein